MIDSLRLQSFFPPSPRKKRVMYPTIYYTSSSWQVARRKKKKMSFCDGNTILFVLHSPKHVVAEAVVVLVHQLLVQKHRHARVLLHEPLRNLGLLGNRSKQKTISRVEDHGAGSGVWCGGRRRGASKGEAKRMVRYDSGYICTCITIEDASLCLGI